MERPDHDAIELGLKYGTIDPAATAVSLLAYIRHLEAAGSAQGDLEERLARLMTPWFGFVPEEWQRCKGNAAEVLAALAVPPSPAPAPLRWSREKPTTEGWWWMRLGPDRPAEAVDVARTKTGAFEYWNSYNEGFEPFEPGCEFAGPIAEPEGTPSETPEAHDPTEGGKYVYCHGCSEAGQADNAIYHLPPACPSEKGAV